MSSLSCWPQPAPTVATLRALMEDVVGRILDRCADYQQRLREKERQRLVHSSLPTDDDSGNEEEGLRVKRQRPPSSASSPIHFTYSAPLTAVGGGAVAANHSEDSRGVEEMEMEALLDGGSQEEVYGHLQALVQSVDPPPLLPPKTKRRSLSFPYPISKAAHCSPHPTLHSSQHPCQLSCTTRQPENRLGKMLNAMMSCCVVDSECVECVGCGVRPSE